MNDSPLIRTLFRIFKILSPSLPENYYSNGTFTVKTAGHELFSIDEEELNLPLPKWDFFHSACNLPDRVSSLDAIRELVDSYRSRSAIRGLNHIGLCYPTASQNNERERLKKLAPSTGFGLYEMKSNDEGLWLFLGDAASWQMPMVEFLPVEKTDDEWKSYWLPHIHIDLDTALTHEDLERDILRIFGRKAKPFRSCVIDGNVYSVRVRLGSLSGVNIMLDLSTDKRDTRFSREKLLTRIA